MTADHRFDTCATDMGCDFSGDIKIGGNYSPVVGDEGLSQMPGVLTDAVLQAARSSVLCWLATVDAQGQPNVSPKEVWAIIDDRHVVVANIASPVSVRNIAQAPKVCLSFVNVLVQKGFKLTGTAREVLPADPEYLAWASPLLATTGDRIPVRSVLLITVQSVFAIVAPSYWLFPDTTTESSQIEAARRAYGLSSLMDPARSANLNPSRILPDPSS